MESVLCEKVRDKEVYMVASWQKHLRHAQLQMGKMVTFLLAIKILSCRKEMG